MIGGFDTSAIPISGQAFFDATALQQAVAELRTLKKADAQESADPTAREAVAACALIAFVAK